MSAATSRRTRLNVRDVHADHVWNVMREHADQIHDVRDVQKLPALRTMNGEYVAVAIADLVAKGRVIGASGAGRIRAVEPPATPALASAEVDR